MARTYTVGPATVAIFRIGVSAPGKGAGRGPVAKTMYLSTIAIGKEGVQMMGEGPGSGQEIEMIGSFIQTLLDAASMSQKEFLKGYGLMPHVGTPVWQFAKEHHHEILQMQKAFEEEQITEQ